MSFSIIVSCILLLFPSMITAEHNITKMLSKYNEYNTFNSLLTQTKLAETVNKRNSITVLAVQDGSISSLSSKSQDVVKRILSTHIILDYYDMKKLKNLQNGTAILITLFQASGEASGQQGYLNVTNTGNGEIKLGPEAKGANLDVSINKLADSQPYNISVLDVSGVINVPGIENVHVSPAQSPRKVLTPAPAPGPHKKDNSSSPLAESPMPDGPAAAGAEEDGAPAPGKSGAVKGRGDVKFLVGLTVFLVVSFLTSS